MTLCPRCRQEEMAEELAFNALSRKDNETYVCSPCGEDEALWDFMKCKQPEWPLPAHYKKMNFEQLERGLSDA